MSDYQLLNSSGDRHVLHVWVADPDGSTELEIELNYVEGTASTVGAWLDGHEVPPNTISDTQRLRAELWASRSLDVQRARERAEEAA